MPVSLSPDEVKRMMEEWFREYYTPETRNMFLMSFVAGDEALKAGVLDAFSHGMLAVLNHQLMIELTDMNDKKGRMQ